MSPLDIRLFGAVGDGQTDSRHAITHAIAVAVRTGREVYVPAGTFLVTLTSSDPSIPMAGSATIRGVSADDSIIRFGPEKPSFAYKGLKITGGTAFVLSNLTLQGPTDPCAGSLTGADCLPVGESSDTFQATYGISYENMSNGATLSLSQVKITGQFAQAFQVGAGYGSLTTTMSGVDFTAYDGTLAYFCDDGITKSLSIYNSAFHDTVHSGALANHLLYIHPSVDLLVSGSTFTNAQYYSIHIFGSPSTFGGATIVGNTFVGLKQGILTNPRGTTTITGNTFRISQGINVRGSGARVLGNSFYADSDSETSVAITYTEGAGPVVVTDSSFDDSNIEVGGGDAWRIAGSTFTSASHVTVNNAASTNIENNSFAVSGTHAVGTGVNNSGPMTLTDNMFTGSASEGAFWGIVADSLSVTRCQFQNTGPAVVQRASAGSLTCTDNTFSGSHGSCP